MTRDELGVLIGANLHEIGGFLDWLDQLDVVSSGETGDALQALVNARHFLDLLLEASA